MNSANAVYSFCNAHCRTGTLFICFFLLIINLLQILIGDMIELVSFLSVHIQRCTKPTFDVSDISSTGGE